MHVAFLFARSNGPLHPISPMGLKGLIRPITRIGLIGPMGLMGLDWSAVVDGAHSRVMTSADSTLSAENR